MINTEKTYIIAKHKILSYAVCPEMIYPLEVHGFTDNEEEAKKRAKKIEGMYWQINKF